MILSSAIHHRQDPLGYQELATHKLHLVGEQEVKWDKGCNNQQTITNSSTEMGMRIITRVQHRIKIFAGPGHSHNCKPPLQ
jgi:hypothetical protein